MTSAKSLAVAASWCASILRNQFSRAIVPLLLLLAGFFLGIPAGIFGNAIYNACIDQQRATEAAQILLDDARRGLETIQYKLSNAHPIREAEDSDVLDYESGIGMLSSIRIASKAFRPGMPDLSALTRVPKAMALHHKMLAYYEHLDGVTDAEEGALYAIGEAKKLHSSLDSQKMFSLKDRRAFFNTDAQREYSHLREYYRKGEQLADDLIAECEKFLKLPVRRFCRAFSL